MLDEAEDFLGFQGGIFFMLGPCRFMVAVVVGDDVVLTVYSIESISC